MMMMTMIMMMVVMVMVTMVMAIQAISAMVEACWPFLDNTPDKVGLIKNTSITNSVHDDGGGIANSKSDGYNPQATRLLLLRTLWQVTRGGLMLSYFLISVALDPSSPHQARCRWRLPG